MAGDDGIAYASAAELEGFYRRRALSPVEVARLTLERLDAWEPRLNAFVIVDRDGAVAAASASEERWHRGQPLGPLDGVPVTIKDLTLMRGFPTLRGSHLVDPEQDWSEAHQPSPGCVRRGRSLSAKHRPPNSVGRPWATVRCTASPATHGIYRGHREAAAPEPLLPPRPVSASCISAAMAPARSARHPRFAASLG